MSKQKERFHKVMAEHYASGGSVKDNEIQFGNQESFLSGDTDESDQLAEVPQGPEFEGVESKEEAPNDKRKQRLHNIRLGK